MNTYTKEGIDIKKVYSVEYIDNLKDFEAIESGKISTIEPWERYKFKNFDDLDAALPYYITLYFRMIAEEKRDFGSIYDVRLFEQLFVNGDLVSEAYVDWSGSLFSNLKTVLNRKMEDENRKNRERIANMNEALDRYENFFNKYPSIYGRFKEEIGC